MMVADTVSLQVCPNSQLWDLGEPSRRLFPWFVGKTDILS